MNRIYLLPAFFAFMLAASLACSAETVNVKMKSLSYDPKELAIHLGDSVTWSNAAFSKHTATSDDDGKTFDTPARCNVKPGEVRERGRVQVPLQNPRQVDERDDCREAGRHKLIKQGHYSRNQKLRSNLALLERDMATDILGRVPEVDLSQRRKRM